MRKNAARPELTDHSLWAIKCEYSTPVDIAVAGHFVQCPLRNLPVRTTSTYQFVPSLYLPLRTHHFVPTTLYPFFKCFMS